MSTCEWINEGIGIKTGDLEPYLDKKKCISVIMEQTNNEIVPDEEIFDIDDYLYGELFENLADMLCHCDDTNTMTFGENGQGEYYFLYPPKYPWLMRENEPRSAEDVHEIIKDAVSKISNLTREQIEELIDDDIYELGWG